MKSTKLLFAGVMAALAFASCSESDEFSAKSELVTDIIVTGEDIVPELGSATRTAYTMGSSLKFSWSNGDTLGIYPIGGSQVDFPISAGEGSNSAAFDGGAWALRSSYTYAAYYPFTAKNFHIKENAIPVDYSGQEQNGNGSLLHLSKYDFMAAAATSPNDAGGVDLAMKHLGSFVRLQLTMPVADTYTSVTLSCDGEKFTTTATYDLTAATPALTPKSKASSYTIKLKNTSTTGNKELLTVYAFVGPTDLSGSQLTITVAGTTNKTYVGTVDGKNMQARGGYNYALEFKSGTNASGDDISFDEGDGVALAESAELLSGEDFNTAIKQLVDPSADCSTNDAFIKKITFRKGYSAEGTIVSSSASKGEARAVYNSATQEVDIYVNANKLVFPQSCAWMFRDFTSVTGIDWTAFDSDFNTSNVTDMSHMFQYCSELTSLNLENFNTSNVTDMSDMFNECRALTSLNVENFDTSNVTDMSCMFQYCSELTSLNLENFNTSNVTDMSYMFSDCWALTSLNVENFDTSNVTSMSRMFQYCYCSELTSLNLENFNTSNVTDMSYMFYACRALTSLDLSNFDTSKVTDMSYMFSNCWALTSLNVENFDTKYVNKMEDMFQGCANLTSLDVTNFNTGNVSDMVGMFAGCEQLTSLDLSNFDTQYVNKMNSMFERCYGLSSLKLGRNFVITESCEIDYMLYATPDGTVTPYCTITCTSATKAKLCNATTEINEEKFQWNII